MIKYCFKKGIPILTDVQHGFLFKFLSLLLSMVIGKKSDRRRRLLPKAKVMKLLPCTRKAATFFRGRNKNFKQKTL